MGARCSKKSQHTRNQALRSSGYQQVASTDLAVASDLRRERSCGPWFASILVTSGQGRRKVVGDRD